MRIAGFGFGLERLGLLALRLPKLFVALLILLTLASAYFVTRIEFKGSITGVLPHTGEQFLNYEAQKKQFRNFSRDVAIIVRSPRLLTTDGMSDLRDLQLDLALEDGVVSAVSVLSLPNFNEDNGQFESFFPADMAELQDLPELLDEVFEQYPQARSLLSDNINAAILLVALDLPLDDNNDQRVFEIYRQSGDCCLPTLHQKISRCTIPDMTPISLTILQTLRQDQGILTIACLGTGRRCCRFAVWQCICRHFLFRSGPVGSAVGTWVSWGGECAGHLYDHCSCQRLRLCLPMLTALFCITAGFPKTGRAVT